jgi:hypothetical protein
LTFLCFFAEEGASSAFFFSSRTSRYMENSATVRFFDSPIQTTQKHAPSVFLHL